MSCEAGHPSHSTPPSVIVPLAPFRGFLRGFPAFHPRPPRASRGGDGLLPPATSLRRGCGTSFDFGDPVAGALLLVGLGNDVLGVVSWLIVCSSALF